jgi:polyhydroxybutyrate depolymerase
MRNVTNGGGNAEWPAVADDHKFLLIAPNGVNVDTGDTSGDDQHWNDCRGDAILSDSQEDDVGFMSALLDWANDNFDIDLERVYATGASNGGMMSYRLARELGYRIAAIAAYIANIPAANGCYGPYYPISVLIINGEGEDHYMPWEGGCVTAKSGCDRGTVTSALATRDFWIEFNGCDPQSVETIDYPDLDPSDGCDVTSDLYVSGNQGTEVKFYTVWDGGHTVPSINHHHDPLFLKLLGLGKQNHDIEAAIEAWDFLSQHTLSGSGVVNPGAAFHLQVRQEL